LNPALYKAFEKYRFGDRAKLCLWYNGQLNTAIREPSCILELQDRLKSRIAGVVMIRIQHRSIGLYGLA
jgi:hypothetical protein